MSYRFSRLAWVTALAAVVLALGAPASAQVFTGRIDVTAQDATGAVLPGVTVDISGPQNVSQITDAQGEAHFLNIAPGNYQVQAMMQGFGEYKNEMVPVGAGAGVPLRITLKVGGVTEQVDVTAETPTIDPKRQSQSTNVSLEELQNIPSARDPWVVLQSVPGIIVDRVNVGGAESGQQSNFQAKGAATTENTWNIDGIPITDMAALGSSPGYYDFDQFQEVQVSTGGSDITAGTPGAQLNFVLKSGANTPHGSTRIYFENESMQSKNMPDDLKLTLGKATDGKGNRTQQYKDYGFEIGGPIMKDRLWAWGAIGKTDVRLLTLANTPDKTLLDDRAFKLTGQAATWLRGGYTFFYGNKQKFGRSASATRPPETTYDQTGPTKVHKGQADLVIGNNLFVTARGAHVSGGFQLFPEGGLDKQLYIDDGGVWHGSADFFHTDRPQKTVIGDATWFRGQHEVKFGFGWRTAAVTSSDVYPGNGVVSVHNGYPLIQATVTRAGGKAVEGIYEDLYISDTISMDRVTFTAGLRYDRQSSSVLPLSVPASSVLPTVLPALSAPGVKDAIVYKSLSPRLGVSWALDDARKTLVRGSYAMFTSQLNATQAASVSAVQYSGIYYYALDLNGNQSADPNELLLGLGNIGYYGFDPAHPDQLTSVNRIGDYQTPKTHEILLGVDHELMPNFGLSATFTYRRFNDFNFDRFIGVTRASYEQTGTLTGNVAPIGQFSVPFYALKANKVPPGGGAEFTARDGYHQRYLGLELSATKRMSNRWMARFGFSTNDHREYLEDPNTSVVDPTPRYGPAATGIGHYQQGPLLDGGNVVTATTGSGKSGIYLVLPKYQFIANGLYQGPWGVNFGASLLNRQGYSTPYFRSNVATGDPLGNLKTVLLVEDVSDFRLPSVTTLDVRLEKVFAIKNFNAIIDLDVFNVTNSATVLGREYDLRLSTFNTVREIMNPRIARIGVRLNF